MSLDLSAVDALAADAHHGQTRRHGSPYIDHPRAVRLLVEDLGYATRIPVDDSMRAAALLHDVIEDSDIDERALRARFGEDVARRVALLTKSGKGDDATRTYYERMGREADVGVRLIKVADRCHNLSELHKAPDPDKLTRYVEETERFVRPVASPHPGLTRALDDAMRAALRAQRLPVPPPLQVRRGRVPSGVYAIVSPTTHVDELIAQIRALCEGGVALIQLRAKGLDDRAVLELLACAFGETARFDVPLIVNDRADLCRMSGVDGLHVGQTDVPAHLARRILPREAIVGTSTHTRAQADALRADTSNDYIAVGPVFASPTKQGHAAIVGTLGLKEIAATTPHPVVAIGGVVEPARAADVRAAGAHCAAAVSALAGPDPQQMARRMALAFAAAEPFSAHASAPGAPS